MMKLLKIQNLKNNEIYPRDVIISFGKYSYLEKFCGFYFKIESPFKSYGEYRYPYTFELVKGYYRNVWMIKYRPGIGFLKIRAKQVA